MNKVMIDYGIHLIRKLSSTNQQISHIYYLPIIIGSYLNSVANVSRSSMLILLSFMPWSTHTYRLN